MSISWTRSVSVSGLLIVALASCLGAQPGKKSQLATVSQVVSSARIEIVYRRPVARGRELFGKLVPYGNIWTPSADSAAVFSTSTDIDVAGQKLKAGTYALWMIPDSQHWTVVFTSAAHVFHLNKPASADEALRVSVQPQSGAHMESLGFYFPMVDADSATLVMHWEDCRSDFDQGAVELASRAKASAQKRRLYLTITLALPWLVLALAEVALRVFGYGSSYPLFISYPDHPQYLVPNQEVAKRYFGNGPFVPTPQLDFFHAAKDPSIFRIIFQGESSAIGFPYVHGGAPSRMLEQRLQESFPDRTIEVVNTALTAVNSYTLVDFADEIIAQHPDAVMIYTGHNEYYGAFGAGTASLSSANRHVVRAYLTLRHLRLAQLIVSLVQRGRTLRSTSSNDANAPRNVMELMASNQTIPFGSSRYKAGLEQFRANLDGLLSRYRAHGIPVFIGTLASNERDQPPFIGAEAMSLYSKAKQQDASGNYQAAAKLYREAKDRDELRFRAPEDVNAVIRSVAARNAATVVETQRALESASPQGIIGKTVMLEHLHPNIEGYFLIADAFYNALLKNRTLTAGKPIDSAGARAMIPVTAVDSLIGEMHTDRLKSGWPFRPRNAARIPMVDTLTPRTITEQLAQAVVLGKMSWPEAMDRLRASYEKEGDADNAIRVALAMAQEYRYSAQPFLDASRIEVKRKRYDGALKYVLAATEREETPKSVQLAGLLLLRQGDYPRGIKYLERSVELAPNDEHMVVPLRSAKVIPSLETARSITPRDTTVLYTLAAAYALTQQYEKSRATLDELRRTAPDHAAARQLLLRLPPLNVNH